MTKYDPVKGPIFFDQTSNELEDIVQFVENRITTWASAKDFDAIDIPSMRACIAILNTILREHNAAHLISIDTVEHWASKIDEPFRIEGRWGFVPWPSRQKAAYRRECRKTLSELRALVQNY